MYSMKRKLNFKSFVLVIVLTLSSVLSFSQTTWTMPDSTGISEDFRVKSTLAVSPSEVYLLGYIHGSKGCMYKSSDGGLTWTEQVLKGAEDCDRYTNACIVGNKILLSAETSSRYDLIYSNENDTVWTLSNSGISTDFVVGDFLVISADVYLFGSLNSSPCIYKSTNSGLSWTEQAINGISSEYSICGNACIVRDTMLVSVHNYSTWKFGMYFSVDRVNWTKVSSNMPSSFTIYDFEAVSSSEVFAVGQFIDGRQPPRIYRSTNGVSDWDIILSEGVGSQSQYYSICKAGDKMILCTHKYVTTSIFIATYPLPLNINSSFKIKNNVYPNPTNGIINLPYKDFLSNTVRISNIEGKICKQINIEYDNTINLSNLENGIYFIEYNTSNGVKREKVILFK